METVTLSGVRMYVLVVIEHGSRRIRALGATAHPSASWAAQAAKNLVMDLEDLGCRARFMIRDRDGRFPELFDAVLKDAGIDVVLSGIQMPRMNSIMERWIQTCRRELPDRTPIWNQRHLLHTLREFEQFYNGHRVRHEAPYDGWEVAPTTTGRLGTARGVGPGKRDQKV
jgi:putative transposase